MQEPTSEMLWIQVTFGKIGVAECVLYLGGRKWFSASPFPNLDGILDQISMHIPADRSGAFKKKNGARKGVLSLHTQLPSYAPCQIKPSFNLRSFIFGLTPFGRLPSVTLLSCFWWKYFSWFTPSLLKPIFSRKQLKGVRQGLCVVSVMWHLSVYH